MFWTSHFLFIILEQIFILKLRRLRSGCHKLICIDNALSNIQCIHVRIKNVPEWHSCLLRRYKRLVIHFDRLIDIVWSQTLVQSGSISIEIIDYLWWWHSIKRHRVCVRWYCSHLITTCHCRSKSYMSSFVLQSLLKSTWWFQLSRITIRSKYLRGSLSYSPFTEIKVGRFSIILFISVITLLWGLYPLLNNNSRCRRVTIQTMFVIRFFILKSVCEISFW